MKLTIEKYDLDELPREGKGYCYLDLEDPFVCWETCLGNFLSSKVHKDVYGVNSPSLWVARTIQSHNNQRFTNELIIETVRAKYFPDKTSRLSGLFFLRDLDSAKDCLNWGGHFKVDNLCEVYYSTNGSITRCDSKWITDACVNSNGIIEKSYENSIHKYWAGEPCPNDEFPAWEYIIDGVLSVLSQRIKILAWEKTLKNFPDSKNVLEHAFAATVLNLTAGHATPYIHQTASNRYRLMYIIRLPKEEIETVHSKSEELFKNFDIKIKSNQKLVTPDFSRFFTEFSLTDPTIIDWNLDDLKFHN